MSSVFLSEESPQASLQKKLAGFFGAGEAILCQSGYVANLGLLQTLIDNTTLPVYFDMMAHMSLWDGARLAGARTVTFLHNDVAHLERRIRQYGPGIVVVDSVYSTNGSICPLKEVVDVASAAGCTLIVDESHAFGTHGPAGRGLVEALGLSSKVMFRTASLAKAFAGRAGLILCPHGFSDMYSVSSRPAIFSSALPPADIAALDKVLDLVASGTGETRREKLRTNSRFLRQQLAAVGLDVTESESQIIALKTRSEWDTIRARHVLESNGVFGAPFCTPATPKKKPLLRLSLHAALTEQELCRVRDACKQIGEYCC